jgi:hypothetical protein
VSPPEDWSLDDPNTIPGPCDHCGRAGIVLWELDPFVAEGIDDPPEEGGGWSYWCRKCYEQRQDDV